MSFLSSPVRQNSGTIDASWWNALRAAGIAIEQFLGGGFIPQTEISIANDQAVAMDVDGLLFDKETTSSATVEAEIRRTTDAGQRVTKRTFDLIYSEFTAEWLLDPGTWRGAVEDGLTFSVVPATGQVQYVSDTMAGLGYEGKMKFKVTTFEE